MAKIRAIRFSGREETQIEEFLEKNPVFDFSTIARIAILEFIKSPKLVLQPVDQNFSSNADDKSHERTM